MMSDAPGTQKALHFHALDHTGALFSLQAPLMNTRIERTQTPTAHIFKLDLPGVKREDVTVDLEDGRVLKITSEKCVKKEDRSDRWHRVERGRGRFMTSFMLPENCKPHETEAAMENGVLTIRVPKVEVRNGRGESIRLAVR